jgi:cell wall assembly regulator SMI1
MTDARKRGLERRASTDVQAAAKLLIERQRTGEVTPEQLAIAAWAGEPAATLAFGRDPPSGVELVEVAWRRLEQWFAIHAPRSLANLAPGASKAALAALERQVRRPLPETLKASWRRHDGQRRYTPAFFAPHFSLVSTKEAGRTWRMLEGMFRTEQDELPDRARRHPRQVRHALWRSGWIPFATFENDTICVDLDPTDRGIAGQVIERPNVCDTFKLLAPSIEDALARFAHELDQGKFVTNGADLFENDEAGRELLGEFAEIDARRARRSRSASKKKAAKK